MISQEQIYLNNIATDYAKNVMDTDCALGAVIALFEATMDHEITGISYATPSRSIRVKTREGPCEYSHTINPNGLKPKEIEHVNRLAGEIAKYGRCNGGKNQIHGLILDGTLISTKHHLENAREVGVR